MYIQDITITITITITTNHTHKRLKETLDTYM